MAHDFQVVFDVHAHLNLVHDSPCGRLVLGEGLDVLVCGVLVLLDVVGILVDFLFLVATLPLHLLLDPFLGPLPEIDSLWELAVVIDLPPLHRAVVELESLQVDDDGVGEVLQVSPPLGADLEVVLLAMVLVVPLEHVRLDVEVECLLDVLFVLDVEADRVEGLVSLPDIGILRLEGPRLVAKSPSDGALQKVARLIVLALLALLGLRPRLRDELLDLVAKGVVKLMGVLLHPDVDRLSVEFECVDEAAGDEVRLLGFLEIGKDTLQLVEHVLFDLLLLLI